MLVLVACGVEPIGQPTTTAVTEDPVATAAIPDARRLSYSLEVGSQYEYEVDLIQHVEMSVTGETAALGEAGLPGVAVFDLAGTTVLTYTVVDGPTEGTYAIIIEGRFADLEVSGTIDGESIDLQGEVPYLSPGGREPIQGTVIVDEYGNVIPDEESIEDLGEPFSGLVGFDPASAPGLDPGQFVGPILSVTEVAMGDTWSFEVETRGFGDDPMVTSITSTLTGLDEIDGMEVFVIETATNTAPIGSDLGEIYVEFMTGFVPPDGEDAAEFEAILEDFRLLMSIDKTSSETVTWFDVGVGLVRQHNSVASTHIVMDSNIPDLASTELSGSVVDMVIDSEIEYRLITAPPA